MEGDYQKLPIKQFAPSSLSSTTEGKYWRKFASPVTTQQIGIVSHISYSPIFPHDFAVTSSTRVLVYDGRTHALKKTLARFPDTAYSANFRSDSRLITAGCESGLVQVFDLSSRAIIRQFTLHKRATHAVHFSADKTHVFSASDDTTARLWDLAQGEQVVRLEGHTDYVRSASCSSQTTWATGSYDHTVKLWDVRTKKAVMTLEHGAPVESIAFFPSGRMAASAGGPAVALWDIVAGGRQLQRITNHQKTVTSVSVVSVEDRGGERSCRLLSSALDGHVKVYDGNTFKVAYAYKYPAPVLTAAVAPDLASMAVGMADRSMVVRRHRQVNGALSAPGGGNVRQTKKARSYAARLTASSHTFFVRGRNSKPLPNDLVIQARRRARLQSYDKLLKAFRYGEALDDALDKGQIAIVISLIEELVARDGLTIALKSRSEASLGQLFKGLSKYVAHPRHSRVVLQVLNRMLDLHLEATVSNRELLELVDDLKGRLAAEAKLQLELLALSGSLEMIAGGAR